MSAATPQQPKLKRSRSDGDIVKNNNNQQIFLGGLKEALVLVQNEASKLADTGLSAFSFFYGFSVCLLTAYLIGAFPESVWLVYGLQGILILGNRLLVDIPRTNPTNWKCFLDFCWIANIVFALLAFYMFLQVIDRKYFEGSMLPISSVTSKAPWIGRVVILFACGPFAFSVLGLRNKLLLHDIRVFSSTFIHLWPIIITLAFRTHPEQVLLTYPGLFDALTGIKDSSVDAGFFHLMQLGCLSYFVWWIPYTIWMVLHGRFQNIEGTGANTVYIDAVQKNKIVRVILGIDGSTYLEIAESASKLGPVLKYMFIHAIFCNMTFMWGILCYKYVQLHFVFCIICLSSALYNASMHYAYLMTNLPSTTIVKEIEKRRKSSDIDFKKD